jgi:hypothetical protein
MFNQLLTLLKRGGTVTIDQAARELDTTPEVVSEMIDHMARAGWLRALSVSCNTHCSECLFARDCVRTDNRRVWSTAGDGHQPGRSA